MGVWQRMTLIFRSKANKALDRAEDPREMLDYSYQRQTELLSKVRRGVADVATSRKRVELQINQLEQQSTKLQGQAEKAIGVDREDLAREALTRKSGLTNQITDLKVQLSQLQGEEEKLTLAQSAARGEGRGVPHPQGDDQGDLHRRRGPDPHQRGGRRHRRGDGRRRPGHPAGRGQDRADAGPRRCRRRADRLGRARRPDPDRRPGRHQPRARGDELAVRRRVRAGPAEGAPSSGALGWPVVGAASWEPAPCRPGPTRHPCSSPSSSRRRAGRDRPHPRGGPVRRQPTTRSTGSTPSTPRSRPRSRPATRRRSRPR